MPIIIDLTANGALFATQLENREHNLDVFADIGLRADGPQLNHLNLGHHFRNVLLPHLFERQTAGDARTQGPEIPTWQQANVAKGILVNMSCRVGTEEK